MPSPSLTGRGPVGFDLHLHLLPPRTRGSAASPGRAHSPEPLTAGNIAQPLPGSSAHQGPSHSKFPSGTSSVSPKRENGQTHRYTVLASSLKQTLGHAAWLPMPPVHRHQTPPSNSSGSSRVFWIPWITTRVTTHLLSVQLTTCFHTCYLSHILTLMTSV